MKNNTNKYKIYEILEYKIVDNNFSSEEYEMYIDLQWFGDEVFEWRKYSKLTKRLLGEFEGGEN